MSDDLVERVAIAIDSAICNGDQSSVAMELTSEEIKVLARAAIAVCMEEAAQAAETYHNSTCNCEVCYGHEQAAAAIRALVQK